MCNEQFHRINKIEKYTEETWKCILEEGSNPTNRLCGALGLSFSMGWGGGGKGPSPSWWLCFLHQIIFALLIRGTENNGVSCKFGKRHFSFATCVFGKWPLSTNSQFNCANLKDSQNSFHWLVEEFPPPQKNYLDGDGEVILLEFFNLKKI